VIDVQQFERLDGVFAGWPGVAACCLEARVAEELGDDDEVGSATYEPCGECMAQDVGGRIVVEAGGRGDGGDDVVGSLDREPAAALIQEQRRVVGAGPAGAFVEPGGQRAAARRSH
jgi:hypothetical protein